MLELTMLSNWHVKFIYTFINDNTVKPSWDQSAIKINLTWKINVVAILKHDLNGPFGLINLVYVAPSITKL